MSACLQHDSACWLLTTNLSICTCIVCSAVQAADDRRVRHRQERLAAMRRYHWQAAAAQTHVMQNTMVAAA